MKNILILPNIRSVINIGAIFRTSDAIGIDKIYLTGYTPTPLDRFGRLRDDFQKSSLGSDKFIDWEQKKDLNQLLIDLQKKGYRIFSIEQDKKSVDYKKASLSEKNVFIFGNEVDGIPEEVLEKSDFILELNMKGKKESLNVATTAGIVLFRLLDK